LSNDQGNIVGREYIHDSKKGVMRSQFHLTRPLDVSPQSAESELWESRSMPSLEILQISLELKKCHVPRLYKGTAAYSVACGDFETMKSRFIDFLQQETVWRLHCGECSGKV
jgi:hypothetical protein